MESLAARLGHDLHNPASRLTVLRLKTPRLYLDFLNKRKIDAAANRKILAGKSSQSAKGRRQ